MPKQKKSPVPEAAGTGGCFPKEAKTTDDRYYDTTIPAELQAFSANSAAYDWQLAEKERRHKRAQAWTMAVMRLEVEFEAAQGGGCPQCLKNMSPEERLGLLKALGFKVLKRFTIDGALCGQKPQWELCAFISGGLFVNLADGWVNRRVKQS